MTAPISNVSSPAAGVVSADTSPKSGKPTDISMKEHVANTAKPVSIPKMKVLPAKGGKAVDKPAPAPEPKAVEPPKEFKPEHVATTIVDAVTSSLTGKANIFVAMAQYGESAGIAGDRKLVAQTLTNIKKFPEVYLPADCPFDTKVKILARCDKSKDEAEFSRTVSACTAGSVLTHYYDEAFRTLAKEEGGLTRDKAGLKQAVIALLSDCAKARTDLKKPVVPGWNGDPNLNAKLPKLIEKAEAKKAANNSNTRGARAGGTTAKPGPVGTAGAAVNPAAVSGPLAGIAAAGAVQEAAEKGDNVPSWESHLNGLVAMLNGLVAKCPAETASMVEPQVNIIATALMTIKKVCTEAVAASAPKSPLGKLVKNGGK
jgi:hypothetical protein